MLHLPRVRREPLWNDTSIYRCRCLSYIAAGKETVKSIPSRIWKNQPTTPVTQGDEHHAQATTLIPIDLAWKMMDLHSPSSDRPERRVSVCLILAIS